MIQSQSLNQSQSQSQQEKQLIESLKSLLEAVEEDLPANPHAKKNQKPADRLEKDLDKYFRSLSQAFPYAEIEKIYNQNVKFEPEDAK